MRYPVLQVRTSASTKHVAFSAHRGHQGTLAARRKRIGHGPLDSRSRSIEVWERLKPLVHKVTSRPAVGRKSRAIPRMSQRSPSFSDWFSAH